MTLRSEEEVNEMIEKMKAKTKGKYITQGVSFNKTCPRQMEMLKKALMSSVSFSGLAKEMLAIRFERKEMDYGRPTLVMGTLGQGMNNGVQPEAPKLKNVGNFL